MKKINLLRWANCSHCLFSKHHFQTRNAWLSYWGVVTRLAVYFLSVYLEWCVSWLLWLTVRRLPVGSWWSIYLPPPLWGESQLVAEVKRCCTALMGACCCWWYLDSFTVPLHSPNGRHLPAVRAVQRDCHWGMKNGGNSHWSYEPIMQWDTRQSQCMFRLITEAWCQPVRGHVLYPTDSPIATRLGLCSSLWWCWWMPWSWCHGMEIFSALLALCKGNPLVTGGLPLQRARNVEFYSLTHWGRDKIDAISQTAFSNAFSWIKMHEFRLGFHWSLFLMCELTIFQHWFR